jgi:hypothetical protein
VEVKWGPCHGKRTGETALLRDIMAQLRPGDVLVADRYYCSYFLIVLLKQLGVKVVFHLGAAAVPTAFYSAFVNVSG